MSAAPEKPGASIRADVAAFIGSVTPGDPEAVAKLCTLLTDDNAHHRRLAADALIQLGPDTHTALPILMDLLRHPEATARIKAIEILFVLGPAAMPALALVSAALGDSDPVVQRWSAMALGQMGAEAKAAVPELLALRETSTDLRTRAMATAAVRKIDPESARTNIDETAVGEWACLYGHRAWVQSVAISPDGLWAISGSGQQAGVDNSIRLWDLTAKRPRHVLQGHSDRVTSVVFFPDGKRCLSGSYDGTVRVWDLEKAEEIGCLLGHKDRVRSVALSPDARLALSGGCDQTLRLWDLQTNQQVHEFRRQKHWVISVAFSPDSCHALSGSLDGTVRFWNVRSGQEVGGQSWLMSLLSRIGRRNGAGQGQGASVTSVAFDPTGQYALSGSTDKTMRLWNLQTKAAVRLEGHTAGVMSVTFAPDGRRILSGSMDQTVRLWDVATRKQLYCFEGHSDVVTSVALSADGRFALSGSADRTVRLWRLPVEESPQS